MFTSRRAFLRPSILTREYLYGQVRPLIAAKVQEYLPYSNHPKRFAVSALRNPIREFENPCFTPFPSSSRSSYPKRNMATSSKIKLSISDHPAFYLPNMNQESADMTSELLTENHNMHHIFFNREGFHVWTFFGDSTATPKA